MPHQSSVGEGDLQPVAAEGPGRGWGGRGGVGGWVTWVVGWVPSNPQPQCGAGEKFGAQAPACQCSHRRLPCRAGEEGCRNAASAGMDGVTIPGGGLAKQLWHRRESPPPHTQLFAPLKSPGRDFKKTKQQKRSRGGRRGRGREPVMEPSQEPELQLDPQPKPQEEAEPVPSSSAPPEPVHQLPVLTIQDLVSEMELGAAEGEQGAMIEDPVGELPEGHWPCGGSGGMLELWQQIPLSKSQGVTKSPLKSAESLAWGLWCLVLNSSFS